MYDPKSEAKEFFSMSRAEAVEKACGFFGLGEDELSIVDLDPTTVSGMAGRTVILALPKNAPRPSPGRRREEERGDRGDRGNGRREARGRRGRGDRDRDRDRDRGRDRDRDRDRDRGRDRDRDRDREPRHRESEPEELEVLSEAQPELDEDVGPSVGTALTELGPQGQFVKGVLERMEIGPFEIHEEPQGDDLVVYQLRGPAAKRLNQGAGRATDAVQFLANQAALRLGDDGRRVVLDLDEDAEAREELLNRAADRAAKRALKTGRSVALEAMSPKDRRLIHLALREMEGVATMSMGSGRYRKVVVVPEGAPEYEKAVDYEATARSE